MPKRQKCPEKKFTESEVRKIVLNATIAAAKHNVLTTFAACGLSVHRVLGATKEQVEAVLHDMDSIAFNSMSFSEVRERLLAEADVDISEFVDPLEGVE